MAAGSTVVAGEVPGFLVSRATAAVHHPLGLVHPCGAGHEALHGGHCKGGLSAHEGVWRGAAAVRRVDHGEGRAAVVLLGVDVAVAAQRTEGQEGERKHGRP